MKCSLVDYLRTGRLGTLALGSTMQEVFASLGKPDSWAEGDKSFFDERWWGFGRFQIFWDKSVMNTMGIYLRKEYYNFPPIFEFEGYIPDINFYSEMLIQLMVESEIKYVFHEHEPGRDGILTEGNILAILAGPKGKRRVISMIRSRKMDEEGGT